MFASSRTITHYLVNNVNHYCRYDDSSYHFRHLLSSANIRKYFELCAFCASFVFFSAVPLHLLNEGHPYSQAGQRAVVGDEVEHRDVVAVDAETQAHPEAPVELLNLDFL